MPWQMWAAWPSRQAPLLLALEAIPPCMGKRCGFWLHASLYMARTNAAMRRVPSCVDRRCILRSTT